MVSVIRKRKVSVIPPPKASGNCVAAARLDRYDQQFTLKRKAMPTLTGYGSVDPGCLLSPHWDENCDLAMTSSTKIVHTDLDTSTRKDLFVPMAK